MANMKREICLNCEEKLIRIYGKKFTGIFQVGYYCESCGKFYDKNYTPLIPGDLIIELTPGLKEYPREEAFKAIFKVLKNPENYPEKNTDKISQVRDGISGSLHPFCRVPGSREHPQRLDRETFVNDLKKDGEKAGVKL